MTEVSRKLADSETAPGLYWPIKTTFLSYVAQLPDGRYSAHDGAHLNDRAQFVFEHAPSHPRSPIAGERLLAFRGDVRFAGHFGMLFVRIAHPVVHLRAGHGSSQDPMRGLLTIQGDTPTSSIDLVEFTAIRVASSDRYDAIQGEEVTLTDSGAELFGGAYRDGEVFEDFTILTPRQDSTLDWHRPQQAHPEAGGHSTHPGTETR